MADRSRRSPGPFRGGFRLLPGDDESGLPCTVEAWGSDRLELVARCVEGAARALADREPTARGTLRKTQCEITGATLADVCASAVVCATVLPDRVVSARTLRWVERTADDLGPGESRHQVWYEQSARPWQDERRTLVLRENEVAVDRPNRGLRARFTMERPASTP